MEQRDRFFSSKNTVSHLSEETASQTQDYLKVVQAFARLTYQSVYVIDYEKKAFDFVSDNPLFLCGLSSDEVKEMGYDFYFKYVDPQDLALLITINEAGFDFYEKLPVNERIDYTISYDFQLVNENRNRVLVNHKLTPLFLNDDGKIWKAMCVVSLSHQQHSGNITISRQNSETIHVFDPERRIWRKDQRIVLTDRETDILRLYARGFTIAQIAERLFISPDTVKFHRKKLFDKIGVDNITEAMSYATHHRLF